MTTLTTSTTDPSGVPVPAVHATLDFDRNARLYTKGLPTCDSGKLQSQSTEVAERVCGSAKIGTGHATAYLKAGRVYEVPQTVTAFNGVPKGGKPTILLHTYGTTPLQVSLVLEGTVSNYSKEGYGPRLDLERPADRRRHRRPEGIQRQDRQKMALQGRKAQLHLGQMRQLEEAQGPRHLHLPRRRSPDRLLEAELQAVEIARNPRDPAWVPGEKVPPARCLGAGGEEPGPLFQ